MAGLLQPLANGFTCPGGSLGVHPALPHPTSCRLYYICTGTVYCTTHPAGCTPSVQVQCTVPHLLPAERHQYRYSVLHPTSYRLY